MAETKSKSKATNPTRKPKVIKETERETGGRHEEVALAAYFRAEKRHFAPGGELNDWLEAEREVFERTAARS